MSLIDKCKLIIKEFEGLELEAYVCPAGFMTIGWGHRCPELTLGHRITPQEAIDLLEHDIQFFKNAVEKRVKVKLTENQLCALISFTFNLGETRLKSSTLLKKLNAGDYKGASKEFIRWNKYTDPEDGLLKESNGLTRRRNAETRIFDLVA